MQNANAARPEQLMRNLKGLQESANQMNGHFVNTTDCVRRLRDELVYLCDMNLSVQLKCS